MHTSVGGRDGAEWDRGLFRTWKLSSRLATYHPLFGSNTPFLAAESGVFLLGNFREPVSLLMFTSFFLGLSVLECSVGDV